MWHLPQRLTVGYSTVHTVYRRLTVGYSTVHTVYRHLTVGYSTVHTVYRQRQLIFYLNLRSRIVCVTRILSLDVYY